MRNPTPRSVSAELRRLGRPHGAFDAARYFRGGGDLRFHNVGAKSVRALARSVHAEHRGVWSVEDAMQLADALMRDPYLETKAVGIEVVARFRRSFEPRLLERWKRWLATDLSTNWATTDLICGMLIGPLLADHPALIARIPGWAGHRNMWVRRASAVALIPPLRRGLALDQVYEVARRLHGDAEDLIRKAVGWMLREAGKADPARLQRYLRDHGRSIPRTTVRYAIERFPLADRRELLAITRPSSRPASRQPPR